MPLKTMTTLSISAARSEVSLLRAQLVRFEEDGSRTGNDGDEALAATGSRAEALHVGPGCGRGEGRARSAAKSPKVELGRCERDEGAERATHERRSNRGTSSRVRPGRRSGRRRSSGPSCRRPSRGGLWRGCWLTPVSSHRARTGQGERLRTVVALICTGKSGAIGPDAGGERVSGCRRTNGAGCPGGARGGDSRQTARKRARSALQLRESRPRGAGTHTARTRRRPGRGRAWPRRRERRDRCGRGTASCERGGLRGGGMGRSRNEGVR